MNFMTKTLVAGAALMSLAACLPEDGSSNAQDTKAVERQQSQYQRAQPIPAFDWSLERDLLIQLYEVRNAEVTTHAVWRSDYGLIEGDCPAMGYGLPYDTSLTNPLVATDVVRGVRQGNGAMTSVGQPEPNGVFASTNTAATWVVCTDPASGALSPVYVEAKVTVYPGRVTVDYETNRVIMSGDPTVTLKRSSRSTGSPLPVAQ